MNDPRDGAHRGRGRLLASLGALLAIPTALVILARGPYEVFLIYVALLLEGLVVFFSLLSRVEARSDLTTSRRNNDSGYTSYYSANRFEYLAKQVKNATGSGRSAGVSREEIARTVERVLELSGRAPSDLVDGRMGRDRRLLADAEVVLRGAEKEGPGAAPLRSSSAAGTEGGAPAGSSPRRRYSGDYLASLERVVERLEAAAEEEEGGR